MYFLYLDESGGVERPDSNPAATPAMVILGVIVDARLVPDLTREFLELKRKLFPSLFRRGKALDHVLIEIKGAEILNLTRSDSRNRRRNAKLIRNAILRLAGRYGIRVVGRVWVKRVDQGLKPVQTYGTRSRTSRRTSRGSSLSRVPRD